MFNVPDDVFLIKTLEPLVNPDRGNVKIPEVLPVKKTNKFT